MNEKIEISYGLDFAGERHLIITDLSGKSEDYGINSEMGIKLAFEILSKELYPTNYKKWVIK